MYGNKQNGQLRKELAVQSVKNKFFDRLNHAFYAWS